MEIKYASEYRSTIYHAVHNTGGLGDNALAPTGHLTAKDIDVAHQQRFNMLSTLGHYGGYNFFIERDGTLTQFRAIGEETAAQRGWNFNGEVVSICMAGNFTAGVERPTYQQIATFKNLIYKIGLRKIVPHRFLQSGTACFGTGLNDNYFNELILGELRTKLSLLQTILSILQTIKASGYKLGSTELQCHEVDPRG